jgi:hypothetical protein
MLNPPSSIEQISAASAAAAGDNTLGFYLKANSQILERLSLENRASASRLIAVISLMHP